MHNALNEALSSFTKRGSTKDRAVSLFGALGYRSERSVNIENVDAFVALLEETKPLTERQRRLFDSWHSADIVFQITGEEIGEHPSLFQEFDKGRINSFLFVAADLEDRPHSRTELAEMTRTVNRGFPMPVILLFRHGKSLTIAAVHRRAHKRDTTRDVLESVTLVKDIRTERPHRAHIDILGELALSRLTDEGVHDFDSLHAAWERVLDIEELNRRFYRDLFEWFQQAVAASRFPDDGAGEGSEERQVIRLITRLLFIWFMKEKGLIPDELFEDEFACAALKNHTPDRTDYYRAVLQNLFFATLNTEIDKRAFSSRTRKSHRDSSKYRYRDLLADPDDFIEMLKSVPFVNGGLFDCLDDFAAAGAGGRRIDVFTDNPTQGRGLDVPARLFLDSEDGLFSLFRHYKFTVEENTPLEQEVALDPELLGRVFENLLAAYNPETQETARKSTGSYYTPRLVVDYMVQEVLAEALATKTEPADGDAEFWRERLLYLLDHSDAMDDADDLFEESDKRAIVAAVANIRTLDPAVGSGAFPMGILQTLTLALRRIDPDNALWEEFQKDRARARAGEAFDTQDQQQRDDALHEISDMFEKYRQSDFGRKLYLIQNSIYGVDIQSIACQIAKLRFFISLVIEQEPNPSAPNLGVRPLPNLETRFIAADTLIGLRNETTPLLLDDAVVSKSKEVAAVRERYFLADSRPKKLECVKEEQRLRDELQAILENEHQKWVTIQKREIEDRAKRFPNPEAGKKFKDSELREFAMRQREYDDALADARKVAEWDPYDQNGCADWFDAEYMFGVQEGFDVVIGNPPYIQLQKNRGELANRYNKTGYKTFKRTGDIYQLFYERGCGLLKPGVGTLAYITSNSWLRAEYGKPLRRWFAEHHTVLRLFEMGKDVFDAIVDACVLLVREGHHKAVPVLAVDIDRLDGGSFPPSKRDWGTLKPEGERPWMALSPVERDVMEKMEAVGTPLKQWDISIYYGIKTGYNDAFIVDTSVRERLIAEDPASEEILKPILRGRDIARYRANWAHLWLIDTHNGHEGVPPIDVNDYPAIKAHLDRFIDSLRRRQDKGVTPYNLRHCAYHEEFTKNKLFWMHMSPYGRFALGKKDVMCNQKVFMVTGRNLEYLCAVLNSTLVTWLVKHTSVTTGMGLCQWDKFTVERIPVVHPDDSTLRWFNNAVDKLLAAMDGRDLSNTKEIQLAIDQAVFDLYDLTAKEIANLMGR